MFKVKRYRFIVLLCLLSQVITVWAQPKHSQHYAALWGEGGYTALANNMDGVKNGGSFGFAFGVGYEWYKRNFVLQTGVDFSQLGGVLRPEQFVHAVPMVDTEGDAYTGKFYFKENRDVYSLGYVSIPLMAGGQFGKFYFLAGGKVGLNVYGKSKVENRMKSTGDYGQFIGEFENMPNHGFMDKDVKAQYQVGMKVHCALSAELGFRILPDAEKKSPFSYRVGAFIDYGLLNINKGGYSESKVLTMSELPYYWPVQNSMVRTAEMEGRSIRPIFAGVKFTMLFRLPQRYDCHCEWY